VRHAYLAALATSALLALPWPALGQAAPQPPSGTEVTVTTDSQGRTVTVERTLANGQVTQEQVTVRSSSGQLLSRTTTAFNPATSQPVARETVTLSLSGSTVTTTEEHLVNNQVVSLEITTTVANGQKTTVEREFALVNGAFTQVLERTETERADSQDGKAGARKTEDDDRRNSASQRSEDNHSGRSSGSQRDSERGGNSTGSEHDSDHGGGGEHEGDRD
jgi:hypothetical protein